MGAKLKEAGVGKRKTVFVCYSMGGLVTKKMLEIFPELGAKLEGVVFLGTPHFGPKCLWITRRKIIHS